MFDYRYNSAGDAIVPVPDYAINSAYAATAKVGDVVKLVNGEVVAAIAGDALVLGVFEGFNVQRETESPKTGKVRIGEGEVYEADYTGGAPVVGTAYNITAGANASVNVAATATPAVKVVKLSTKAGKVYVKITGRQLG